ncbi:MAG: type I-E CRISPR-associated protein Cas5/CasD [Rhodospirillales bacterium]|nr:type I-E CRISPR-associated protein Cas5/CasD [Rhodospirillales bacterium]
MDDHLVFTLSGPVAAFGSYAGHERRGTDLVPGRSAILGLLAAALGMERDNHDAWEALRGYRTASRLLTESTPLRDYHTVQTVSRKIRRPDGRRTALEAVGRDVNTLVTVRDYRTDVAVAVAVWAETARWPLSQFAEALRAPAFVLYLGRKSCPPAAPLGPEVVQAPDPVAALRSVVPPEFLQRVRLGPVASDPFPGGRPDRVETAPVEPLDRTRWHFGLGEVWYFEDRPEA